MEAYIIIPAAAFSTVTSIIALYDLYKYQRYAHLPARSKLLALLILGNCVSPILKFFILTLDINFKTSTILCYAFVAINWSWLVSYTSELGLALMIYLIIFTKIKHSKINRAANIWLLIILVYFLIFQILLLPLSGVKEEKPETIRGTTLYRNCVPAYGPLRFSINLSQFITCILLLLIAILIFTKQAISKKPEKTEHLERITRCFLAFSTFSLLAAIRYTISTIFGISLSQKANNLISAFNAFLPGLYSLTYLLTEAYGRKKRQYFPIKRILQLYSSRQVLKSYFADRKRTEMLKLLEEWEYVLDHGVSSLNRKEVRELSKEEALLYIEKNLELEAVEFLHSEEWNDFYEYWIRMGRMETLLAEKRPNE